MENIDIFTFMLIQAANFYAVLATVLKLQPKVDLFYKPSNL